MSDGSDFIIKTDTQQLVSIANEVDTKINRLEDALKEIDQQVKNSKRYWEGDGNSAHVQTYQTKMDTISQALKRFRENADHLRTIAGTYNQAEDRAKQSASSLRVDQIV